MGEFKQVEFGVYHNISYAQPIGQYHDMVLSLVITGR